jgi:methionyl-tRNA formyltransferase
MKIDVMCTDPAHPVVPSLRRWVDAHVASGHVVRLIHERAELGSGDVLFLVSTSQIIGPAQRAAYRASLVLHASDLPRGRGWSPHVWAVLQGASRITVCLLEAADPVDTGPVWLRSDFTLDGTELLAEINEKLFAAELGLMSRVVRDFDTIRPVPQSGEAGPYLRRRTLEDSRLDPQLSIADQFDLLRVVDAQRFPAFFDWRGQRYLIRMEKVDSRDPH